MLARVTGVQSVPVAASKDSNGIDASDQAQKTIKAFGESRDRWLVAVAMVSEGVDIPQLRVGVYATNKRTELFFRQVLGRLVRVRGDLPEDVDQTAYMFVPKEEGVIALADAVTRDRRRCDGVAGHRRRGRRAEGWGGRRPEQSVR
jgi:superfamily II DNA or RNA helicase